MNPTEELTADRGFLPLEAASQALGWFVNPHGSVSESKLREAVSGKVVLLIGASGKVLRPRLISL